LRHFAYGFHPCGTLRVPNFVTRDRLDSQSLRFACPSVLLPPPSSKKSQERLAARKGRKNTPKATPKATQKKTQKKHKKTQKKTQKNAKKMQKKCKKLGFSRFSKFHWLLGAALKRSCFFPVPFSCFFRVFFLWSLSLLRWVLFFSRVFSVFLPAICIGILFWLYSPLILGCAPVFCLRFHLVLIVALQLAVWSANLHRAGHLKLESLDWRNIAKHQTRHGKQKKPRSNTKNTIRKQCKRRGKTTGKKHQKNTKKMQNRNTKKTPKKRETIKIHNPGLWLVKHLIRVTIVN